MNARPTVHILVGNIASGKSSVAKRMAENGVLVISLDALRRMRTGGEYDYDEDWEPVLRRSEEKIIETAMFYNCDMVLDDARFVCKSHRKIIRNLADKYGYSLVIHVMKPISKDEAIERRMANNPNSKITRKIWESVWDKFDRWYETVSDTEGEIIYEVPVPSLDKEKQ
jgi:predicted kinase